MKCKYCNKQIKQGSFYEACVKCEGIKVIINEYRDIALKIIQDTVEINLEAEVLVEIKINDTIFLIDGSYHQEETMDYNSGKDVKYDFFEVSGVYSNEGIKQPNIFAELIETEYQKLIIKSMEE